VNHLHFGGHNHIPGTADRLMRCQLSSPMSVINFSRSAVCRSHPPSRSVFSS